MSIFLSRKKVKSFILVSIPLRLSSNEEIELSPQYHIEGRGCDNFVVTSFPFCLSEHVFKIKGLVEGRNNDQRSRGYKIADFERYILKKREN